MGKNVRRQVAMARADEYANTTYVLVTNAIIIAIIRANIVIEYVAALITM